MRTVKTLTEIWRDIKGYEGLYQISNLGRVKSMHGRRPRILKPGMMGTGYREGTGYLFVILCKNGVPKKRKVHRLVATAFIPNTCHEPQVNHKDGNKLNNRVDNLEWCSATHNICHAYRTGLNSGMKSIGRGIQPGMSLLF